MGAQLLSASLRFPHARLPPPSPSAFCILQSAICPLLGRKREPRHVTSHWAPAICNLQSAICPLLSRLHKDALPPLPLFAFLQSAFCNTLFPNLVPAAITYHNGNDVGRFHTSDFRFQIADAPSEEVTRVRGGATLLIDLQPMQIAI